MPKNGKGTGYKMSGRLFVRPIMFQVFPKGRGEWLRAALFLFQAYVIVAYCVEQYFIRSLAAAGGYRGALNDFRGDVILGYAVCHLVLSSVGVVQMCIGYSTRGLLNVGLAVLAVFLGLSMDNFVVA